MPVNYNQLLNASSPGDTKKPGAGLFAELGIYSPTEKIEAKQAQQLLQQQIAAQQQQQQLALAQAKANVPQGYGFSQFLGMGGLQNIQQAERGTRAAQGMLSGPQSAETPGVQGIDPRQIVLNALRASPDDKGKAFRVAAQQLAAIGQQNGDEQFMTAAANLMDKATEADKEKAGVESTQATTEATKQKTILDKAQAGNPGKYQDRRDPNGNLMTDRDQFDENGKYLGTKTVSGGPVRQINQTIDDPRTATQRGNEYQEFQKLLVNTDSTISAMHDITTNLAAGAAQGWAASAVTLVDNAVGTLAQLAPGSRLDASATRALESNAQNFQAWANKTGVNESIWNDLVSNLAKTYNPTGTITEKDITRAAKTVGQNISNPKTVAAVLQDAERRSAAFVDKNYEYMGEDARVASDSQYRKFKDKFGKKEPSKKSQGGPKAAEVDAAGYEKLQSGDHYRKRGDKPGTYRIKK
jgi:hypothetical protein